MAFSVCNLMTGVILTRVHKYSPKSTVDDNLIVLMKGRRSKSISKYPFQWRPWNSPSPGGRPAFSCLVSNGSEGGRDRGAGDERLQGMLIDMIRVQSDRVRVSELVEDKTRLLNGIMEGAKEEYQRIAEETLKNMDMAGNRVNLPCYDLYRVGNTGSV